MKKLIVFGALALLVAVAKTGCASMSNVDWEQRIESMPDNAPPNPKTLIRADQSRES
jgi:hypothetical protein